MKAIEIYQGSDGEATMAYYAELVKRGPLGELAMELFRAQKKSARAKVYRGRFKGAGYDVKQWSIIRACRLLKIHSSIVFGWKLDPATLLSGNPSWVVYIDLPQGQVSFHCPIRGPGPDYGGEWDGVRKSAERVIAFCDSVMASEVVV